MTEGQRVLIIDHNEQARTFASAALTRAGFIVVEAGDPAAGVDSLRTSGWSAILLDLKMPHNGVAMIDYISENLPGLLERIIILAPSVNRPIWGVLSKPFEETSLVSAVTACAAKYN
jgi:CheY-like chemotaxis protein